MKKFLIWYAVSALSICNWMASIPKKTASKDLYLIDTIKVVIYTEEGADIITQSQVDRPGIDGTFKSLDDLIFERLMYMDAKRFKMLPDEESIDKHLKEVQKENNLTLNQLKDVFKAAGYTYEEGREQFAVMTAIGSMLDFRIRSRLIVPEREVTAYYNANPVKEPAAYYIERAVVQRTNGETQNELRERINRFLAGNHSMALVWGDPFWITISELAEDKQFITKMVPGSVSEPLEIEVGFELFSLKEAKQERIVPLEERYREIANILRKPRYEQLMEEYRKNLFDNASILRLEEPIPKISSMTPLVQSPAAHV